MFRREDCWVQGTPVDPDLLGELHQSHWRDEPVEELRRRFARDGYLFLRGVLDTDDVAEARREVFTRLAEVGEVHEPVMEGIATGVSQRIEVAGDLGRFWQSVSEGESLRVVSHGRQMGDVISGLFDEPARAHDYMFLRPGVVGRATRLHYDRPFFARGSDRVVTVWTALGDIPVEEGTLMVVEGSNGFDDLIAPMREIDYSSKESPTVQLMGHAAAFVRSRETRLLTADFSAGDAIIFSMTLLHGTFDNHSPINRTRLSCDVRWQPAADPVDPRYAGPKPTGTTGVGYAELNGAKPLTEDWHTR